MNATCRNNIYYFTPPYPHPALRNLKRDLILRDLRQGLFFFDLSGFDERLLFSLYLLVQFGSSTLFRALLDQLPLNGKLEDAVF